MSRSRPREFWCSVVSETVEIRLKRPSGFGRVQGYFVQCNQNDCQYVRWRSAAVTASTDFR